MPIASTPGQRAKWRVERAVKAGRPVNPEDLEMMSRESLPIPEGVPLQSQPLSQAQEQSQYPQQSQETPATPHLLLTGPRETGQASKDDGLEAKIPNRKPEGKKEKDWYDYYAYRFGPFILLIIWFITANLEKATFFAPTPDECKAIALPAAKISAKIESWFKVPTWVHDVIISSDDATIVGIAVVGYLDRIGLLERIVPYYTGLASRMGAVNAKYKPGSASNGISNNGYVQEPAGWSGAGFAGQNLSE